MEIIKQTTPLTRRVDPEGRRMLDTWEVRTFTYEINRLKVLKDGAVLGNHSHPYDEDFTLFEGGGILITWSEENGREERPIEAPMSFIIRAKEEHVLHLREGTILSGRSPVPFDPKNMIPATHI